MTVPLPEFLAVWSFLAMNVLSPGPNVLNTIATAMGGGRVAGLGAALGVCLGIGAWSLAMMLGVSALFAVWPRARGVMVLAAAALLVWFAWRQFRTARAGLRQRRRGLPAAPPAEGFGPALRRSLAINATNPKALTTWTVILSMFPLARAGAGDMTILALGAMGVAGTIHAAYALAFSTPAAARGYLAAGWAVAAAAGAFFLWVAVRLVLGELG